jgi:hypothetical protein
MNYSGVLKASTNDIIAALREAIRRGEIAENVPYLTSHISNLIGKYLKTGRGSPIPTGKVLTKLSEIDVFDRKRSKDGTVLTWTGVPIPLTPPETDILAHMQRQATTTCPCCKRPLPSKQECPLPQAEGEKFDFM